MGVKTYDLSIIIRDLRGLSTSEEIKANDAENPMGRAHHHANMLSLREAIELLEKM